MGKGDPTSALHSFAPFRVGPSVVVGRVVSLRSLDGSVLLDGLRGGVGNGLGELSIGGEGTEGAGEMVRGSG